MVERLRSRGLMGELAAEFAGTMILILIGVGVVAQVVGGGIGDHDSIAWAWGLGVILGVYIAGTDQRRPPQSGGHRGAWPSSAASPGARWPVRAGPDRSARSSPRCWCAGTTPRC